jgi:hypothetical protein
VVGAAASCYSSGMRLTAYTYCIVLAVGLACAPKSDPGGSDSDASESGETAGTAEPIEPTPCEGAATPIDATAIAFAIATDLPDCSDYESGTGCWDGPPDGSLAVHLSNRPYTCDPSAQYDECGAWDLSFAIPAEYQAPGLYHLTGPTIRGSAVKYLDPGPDGHCEVTSELFHATLEIVAVDDTGVTGRLCHIESPLYADAGIDLAGSFFAPVCD